MPKKIENILKDIPIWIANSLYEYNFVIREVERKPKDKLRKKYRKEAISKYNIFKKAFYIVESSVKFNCVNGKENFIILNKKGRIILNVESNDINICWLTKPTLCFKFDTKEIPMHATIPDLKLDFLIEKKNDI